MPVICTEKVELNCALLNEAPPETLPVAVGANVAVNVALLPTFNVSGRATPPIVKPVPDTPSCEIVTADAPEFVIVKL